MAVLKPQFTLRLDLETHYKVKKIAEQEKRSMTNMIEYYLQAAIRDYEKQHGEIELTPEDLALK